MVFIIVIILSLISTYLLISSGVFKGLNWFKKPNEEEDTYEIDELVPGMLGSYPSDDIDVYDSKKPITIPMEGAITTLVRSFKENAQQVFIDFNNNKNSVKYKEYVFNDYKLELLRRNGSLIDNDLDDYYTIRNTTVRDINNLFTYHLDKVKYNESKSYFIIRREFLNVDGTSLLVTEANVDAVANYVLSNTDIPGSIILLIKYKVSYPAQELIDQIVMLAGYNYTTVLEILEQVLAREPPVGISLLGIVNSSKINIVNDVSIVNQGFWTQVYYTFKNNNIDNFLIAHIKMSFMNESIYKDILATLVSNMQNPKLTEAMNNIVKLCRESDSRIIKTFPYNFTHALVIDAINENRVMLKTNKMVNLSQIDISNAGIANIDKYSNLERNFPVAIQNLSVKSYNTTAEYRFDSPTYPILSGDYLVNNYLSFPNIKHQGIYFDRTEMVSVANSGYIVLKNTNIKEELIIRGIVIYGITQTGIINNELIPISETLDDVNIIINPSLISVESGEYNLLFKEPIKFRSDISNEANTNWLSGNSIVIPPNKSIRIRATKTLPNQGEGIISQQYLRLFGILIPLLSKPATNFLKVALKHDKSTDNDDNNEFNLVNIPFDLPNILLTFNAPYSFSSNANINTVNTSVIFKDNLKSGTHSRIIITGAEGSELSRAGQAVNAERSTLISSDVLQNVIPNNVFVGGLTTDTSRLQEFDLNQGRLSNRIKIKNTNSNNNPITIEKLIVFGDTSSNDNFERTNDSTTFLNDDNVLYRNTRVQVFTMNEQETELGPSINSGFVIDVNNRVIKQSDWYNLAAGSSIYIEPTVARSTYRIDKYINIKAIYIELHGLEVSIELSIISLNPDPSSNRKATLESSKISGFWNSGAALIMFNPLPATTSAYSPFTILPNYNKHDNFSTLPNYMEDKFQVDYYDQYYNPVSELTQFPANFY